MRAAATRDRELVHRDGVRRGRLGRGRMRIRDRGVQLDLALEEDEGVEALCTHGRGRGVDAQAGGRARARHALARRRPTASVEALAVIDDTAGYHARHTEWRWSAGVGGASDGVAARMEPRQRRQRPAQWERARGVGRSARPSETRPVSFATDLSEIICEDGSKLSFAAEAERSRKENMLIVS